MAEGLDYFTERAKRPPNRSLPAERMISHIIGYSMSQTISVSMLMG